MPLYPALSPQNIYNQDQDILNRMEVFYSQAITINQAFWAEADTDTRFESGDQTQWSDIYGNLPVNRRKQFNFNHIRKIINSIDGYQRRNRKSTIVVPVENADAQTADQFTKVMMWINKNEGVLETISDAFHGALVTGMNLLQVWLDFRSDPISGNIRLDVKPYNSFMIDPYFRKPDLSDCNGIYTRQYVTKRQAISFFPKYTDRILALNTNLSGNGRDGKFQFMPEQYNWGVRDLLSYDEFYYPDFRTQQLLMDSETGETMEWRGPQERLDMYLQQYPQVTVANQEIRTIKLAVVIQGEVFYNDVNPLGIDIYPFVPFLGYYNPQIPYFPQRVQGVVRGLRDAQFLYNRRKVIQLDILESQITSGYIYKENALVDPNDVYLSGQGKGLALKTEASMGDVVKMEPPKYDPTVAQIDAELAKEMPGLAGVNDELLGSATDDKAGILSMLRQGAGLTTLQILFDHLDQAQKLLGNLMLQVVQTNYTPGKIQKILEGEKPADQFYNKAFGKYNCSVEEGINSVNQQQMQLQQMLALREVGVPIPDDQLLEAAILQNKTKIIESMKQSQEQRQQMEQQQMQMQMMVLQADIEAKKAKAGADQGLEIERISRVETDRAMAIRQLHEANRDDEAALLDKVRAIKELESMDLTHLEQLVNMVNSLKEAEQATVGKAPGEGQAKPKPKKKPVKKKTSNS